MLNGRAQRAITSWIASLAILMATLAPAISHAIGSTMPPSWTEICSSTGTKLVSGVVNTTEKNRMPGTGHHLDHCPYCSLHSDAVQVPPAIPALPLPLLLPDKAPAAFLHADRALSVWAGAQPRAPPFLA